MAWSSASEKKFYFQIELDTKKLLLDFEIQLIVFLILVTVTLALVDNILGKI